jgi:hypothetical protein
MFEIESYIEGLIARLRAAFGERLLYVGLQGSHLRGEARKDSDIDAMVVVDHLSAADMDQYRAILVSAGQAARACGFFCGRGELINWNPLEACQILHTTKDYYGRLADFLPHWTRADERNYVKLSLNNLYHALCHRYIHGGREKSIAKLPAAGKQVFFILQNMVFLRDGVFAATHRELLERLDGADRAVLQQSMALSEGAAFDFDAAFGALLSWVQDAISRS